jgi:hypothetical protein
MKLSDFETYENNPFEISGVNLKQIVKKGPVMEIANTNTGEVALYQQLDTHISYSKDSLQFVKVFSEAINHIKTFSPPALKVWCYVMENISISKDVVIINVHSCAKYAEYDSKSAVYKGICELIDKKFIARKTGVNEYFINPDKFFNGKRA